MRTVESGTWLRACVLAYDKENTHHRADVIKQAEVALGSEIQCQGRPDGGHVSGKVQELLCL